MGEGPVHQTFIQEPPCQVPSVARHALSHWLWYDIILVGQMECISSEHFSEGSVQDSNSVLGDIGATHVDPMEAVQSFVCVVIGIHGRGLAPTLHV